MAKISSPTRVSPRKAAHKNVMSLRSRVVQRKRVSGFEPVLGLQKQTRPAVFVNKDTGVMRFEKPLTKEGKPRCSYFQHILRSLTESRLRDGSKVHKLPVPVTALAC